MNKHRRWVVMPLAALAMTLGFAACGGSEGSGEVKKAADINLYYSAYDRQVAFFRGCIEGVQDTAKKQGIDVDLEISGLDPTKQIQQLENAILQRPDGIIITAIDATAVENALKRATDAGIPVIGICDDYGAINRGDAGPGRVSWVGQDMELYGTQKAEFVYETLKREGRLDRAKIGAFYGVRGVPFDVATRAGIQKVVDKYPQAEFIEGPYAGEYSALAGIKAAQNLLSAHPDLDALICDQSDTCIGAVRAIEEAGIDPDDIIVTSGDGQAAELERGRKGKIDYTTVYCAYDEGVAAVDQMTALLLDQVGPPEHTVDLGFGVNSSSVDELKSDNIDSREITAGVNSVEEPCDEPRFEVTNAEPNAEQLEALGIDAK